MKSYAGLDLGKGAIKWVIDGRRGSLPSWLSLGRISNVLGNNAGGGSITYKGQDYTLGKEAILGNSFSWSSTEDKDEVRNLLFALYALGHLGITDCDVVIGLPISSAKNPAAVQKMKGLLEGTHEISINGKSMVITMRVGILCEGLGAYFTLVLDQEGKPVSSNYFNELVGICDIGWRDVNVLAVDGGKLAATSDSTLSGITTLFDQVCKMIETSHGKLRSNEISKVHTWLVSACQEPLKIGGQYVRSDMSAEVARLRLDLARQIMVEVQSVISSIRPDRWVLAGGGSALLRSEFSQIDPHLEYIPNPQYANAVGFFRAACARKS